MRACRGFASASAACLGAHRVSRPIWAPIVWLGLSVSNGFWKIIWIDEMVFTARLSTGWFWIAS